MGLVAFNDEKEKTLILEQYRILTESLNKSNEVRERVNSFWTTINGAIFAVITYIKDMQFDQQNPRNLFIWSAIFFGFIASLFWIKAISSIKKSIDIRNEMLIEIEKFLPVKIFTNLLTGEGNTDKRVSLSSTEKSIPSLFCIGYILIAIIFIYYI